MKQIIKYIYKKTVPKKIQSFIDRIRLYNKLDTTKEIKTLKQELLYFKILHYFKNNNSEEFQNEIEYLNNNGTLTTFPYNRTDKKPNYVETGFDEKKKMPYIYHKGKKLYFPKSYDEEEATQTYLNLIVRENILGGKYLTKNPHQYQTESFFVKDGDIVIDIGAAEGLFLLDVIDKAKYGYLFESDKSWVEPLKATFEPYKEKVTIINKLASNKDSLNELTIDSCLKYKYGNTFMKMDVEGYEELVLSGSEMLLNQKYDIRIACCTYHKHDDASQLEKYFKDINYDTEFSDGYILFYHDEKIKPPYFRKGLIRARNAKEE